MISQHWQESPHVVAIPESVISSVQMSVPISSFFGTWLTPLGKATSSGPRPIAIFALSPKSAKSKAAEKIPSWVLRFSLFQATGNN